MSFPDPSSNEWILFWTDQGCLPYIKTMENFLSLEYSTTLNEKCVPANLHTVQYSFGVSFGKIKRRFFWQETLLSESWGSTFRPWMNNDPTQKVCYPVCRKISETQIFPFFYGRVTDWGSAWRPIHIVCGWNDMSRRVVCGKWLFLYKIARCRGGTRTVPHPIR